ncbi:MFS transporter [archaeon]|nr:MAG: MFS transporter [archaeon]
MPTHDSFVGGSTASTPQQVESSARKHERFEGQQTSRISDDVRAASAGCTAGVTVANVLSGGDTAAVALAHEAHVHRRGNTVMASPHVHHAHGVNVPLHDGTRLTSTNARVRRHAALHELHHASIIDMLLFRAPVAGFLFVMLYISCFVILGVALIFVNSAGLIIKAQHHAESTSTINALISNTVIIFAMCNTAARAFGGALTDWLAFRGYSRLHVLYVAGVMTLVGAFVLAYTPENAIIPVAVLIGLGDGLGFAVWPVFTCEIFGKARYGKMFAIMNSSVGFGSLAFNAMSSSIYSEHAYHNALDKLVCTEAACYKNTWVIAGALVTAIGVPTCLIVYWQQARYDLRHHDHRQHAAAIAGAGPGACPPAGQQPLSPGMLQPSAVPTPAVGARKYGRPVAHSWAEVNLGFNEPRQLPMFSPEPTPAASPSPAPMPVVSAPATSLKSAGQVV